MMRTGEGGGKGVRGEEGIEAKGGEELFHCAVWIPLFCCIGCPRGYWCRTLCLKLGRWLYSLVCEDEVFVPSLSS